MAQSMRFGRKIALPSTRQIRHELLVFAAAEETRVKALDAAKLDIPAALPSPAPVDDDTRT